MRLNKDTVPLEDNPLYEQREGFGTDEVDYGASGGAQGEKVPTLPPRRKQHDKQVYTHYTNTHTHPHTHSASTQETAR